MSKQNDDVAIDVDAVEEAHEVLKYAIENKSWIEVESAFELLSEVLGYEIDEEEESGRKRNHLEE